MNLRHRDSLALNRAEASSMATNTTFSPSSSSRRAISSNQAVDAPSGECVGALRTVAAEDTHAFGGDVFERVWQRQVFEAGRGDADDRIDGIETIGQTPVSGAGRDQHHGEAGGAILPRRRGRGRGPGVGFESEDAGFEVPEDVGNRNPEPAGGLASGVGAGGQEEQFRKGFYEQRLVNFAGSAGR